MQATFPLGRSSIQGFVIALGVAAVLILGMVGGYWLKSLAPAATGVVTVAKVQAQSTTGSSQGPQNRNLESIGSSGAPAQADEGRTYRSGIQY